jgi:hypothetical protein
MRLDCITQSPASKIIQAIYRWKKYSAVESLKGTKEQTICMSVRDKNSVDPTESILWKPFQG